MNNNRKNRIIARPIPRGRRTGKGVLQALFAIVLLAGGIYGAITLVKMRKPPAKAEQEVLAPLVKTEQLRAADIQMTIEGNGTVKPRVEVDIVPEVPGKVVSIHPQMKVGGFIRAGETILQIDKRDYKLAVEQSNAVVAQAQVALDMEKAEAEVAKKEWEQLHPGTEPDSPLVLREPQIRQAEASLESANAQLATANLKLERTEVSLPLDILITSEKVDLGQYVNVGQSLGSGYGVDAVEIEVPLEDEELAWFDVFGGAVSVNGNGPSSKRTPVTVKARFAGAEHTWQGYVTRTTGQADRMSRMVSVVVEVAQPFDGPSGKPPLLPGVFADVIIEGRILKDAVAVPRDAIREGNKIWVVNDGRFHVRSLDIVRSDKDYAYAVSGLEDNTAIIVSSLDAAVDGMEVRTADEDGEVAKSPGGDANQPSESEAN